LHVLVRNYEKNILSFADPVCLSRIRLFSIPDANFFPSRIHIKEFKYFNPKNCFLSSRKYDPGCSSRIRILIFLLAPDPGVTKKAPDPGSGSATLLELIKFCKIFVLLLYYVFLQVFLSTNSPGGLGGITFRPPTTSSSLSMAAPRSQFATAYHQSPSQHGDDPWLRFM
jgi:hypothetical protein